MLPAPPPAATSPAAVLVRPFGVIPDGVCNFFGGAADVISQAARGDPEPVPVAVPPHPRAPVPQHAGDRGGTHARPTGHSRRARSSSTSSSRPTSPSPTRGPAVRRLRRVGRVHRHDRAASCVWCAASSTSAPTACTWWSTTSCARCGDRPADRTDSRGLAAAQRDAAEHRCVRAGGRGGRRRSPRRSRPTSTSARPWATSPRWGSAWPASATSLSPSRSCSSRSASSTSSRSTCCASCNWCSRSPSAPLFVGLAVYDHRNRFVQWWLDLFTSAMLLPVILAVCGSLTAGIALFFLGGNMGGHVGGRRGGGDGPHAAGVLRGPRRRLDDRQGSRTGSPGGRSATGASPAPRRRVSTTVMALPNAAGDMSALMRIGGAAPRAGACWRC